MAVDGVPARYNTRIEDLDVRIYDTEDELGVAAARHTATVLREAVDRHGQARVVFATGNSQLAFAAALAEQDIPWAAVTVFHMDEYIGIAADHPASFRRWITEQVANPMAAGTVHLINGNASDIDAECQRYEALLRAEPIDMVCMGIGENGHLAFNEPGTANFADPVWVRTVELDDRSRRQQVDEGHFADLATVPAGAVSLTIPALLSARHVQVVVPERRKAEAVRAALTDPIDTGCPASVLRRAPHAVLRLDLESASLLGPDLLSAAESPPGLR